MWQSGTCEICANTSTTLLYRRISQWKSTFTIKATVYGTNCRVYTELLTSGRLNTYLVDINEQAEKQMLLLTKQIAEREGVTEKLKAQDQIMWVQRMNNVRDRAMEIMNHELIYA